MPESIFDRRTKTPLKFLFTKSENVKDNFVKGGFFSESAMCFSNLQKKFQKTILCFKLRIIFWNIFSFGEMEIWKTTHTFCKKATFRYIPTYSDTTDKKPETLDPKILGFALIGVGFQ